MATHSKALPWVRAYGVWLIALAGLVLGTRVFTLNVEPSVPLGLYQKVDLPPVLTRGMLVILPPPAVIHRFRPWWQDMLKPIAAVPGDQVCVLSAGLWINGEPYGKVWTEAHGYPLPRLRGCFTVLEETVFVASRQARSIDSRYFGVRRRTDLTAQALPLWTWREHAASHNSRGPDERGAGTSECHSLGHVVYGAPLWPQACSRTGLSSFGRAGAGGDDRADLLQGLR